jgi:soluble cytochrome b562
MRRFVIGTAAMVVVWLGVVGVAQTKIVTLADYAAVMKSNAQSFGATNKAVASGAFADAKTQLATVRGNFVALQGFWTEKKQDAAVGIVKDGLTKIDALDKLLAATPVDQMAAQAAAKEVQGACGACHKQYREGDNQTGFKFKAGVI